jgi:hypothetical protein
MSIRTFVALSLLATTAAAFAGPAGAPRNAFAGHASGGAVASPNTKQVLIASYDSLGNGGYLPQFTFTTVTTNKVNCPNAAGCSIGIEAMDQVQTGGADWAICLRIDGASVSCQYQGMQPDGRAFVVGNARGWGTVSQGIHTVDAQLYTDGASAMAGYFQTDVRVYKP